MPGGEGPLVRAHGENDVPRDHGVREIAEERGETPELTLERREDDVSLLGVRSFSGLAGRGVQSRRRWRISARGRCGPPASCRRFLRHRSARHDVSASGSAEAVSLRVNFIKRHSSHWASRGIDQLPPTVPLMSSGIPKTWVSKGRAFTRSSAAIIRYCSLVPTVLRSSESTSGSFRSKRPVRRRPGRTGWRREPPRSAERARGCAWSQPATSCSSRSLSGWTTKCGLLRTLPPVESVGRSCRLPRAELRGESETRQCNLRG